MAREMRHSGIEWIGEIPKEWRVKRIKHSCKLFGRIGFRGYTADDLVNEGEGAITLSPSNMDGIKLDFSHCSYLSWDKYEESPEIKVAVGDVLLVKTASVGKCAYVDNLPMECTVNPQILVLKEHRDCSKFIAYIFQTPLGQAYIDVTKGGTTISTISQEKIGNYEFAFPPISEQQKIANYLDKVCGEVDEMIALQEQMIEELKAYKQSVITEAVTKGLNPDAPMKDSGIDWIKELPENWEVVTPKALFSLRREKAIEGERQLTASQQFGVIYQDEYMQLTGTKVVTVMKDFDILKHVEAGDFVISMRSFQGGLEYSENTGSISSAYVMLIPNLEYVHPKFYRWLFKSVCYINALQSTSNMVRDGQAMRYSNFAQVPLYIVPLKEQQSIASYLDTKCAEIDALIAIKQAKIEELKDYKKSIIYEYVTGKKEVV